MAMPTDAEGMGGAPGGTMRSPNIACKSCCRCDWETIGVRTIQLCRTSLEYVATMSKLFRLHAHATRR